MGTGIIGRSSAAIVAAVCALAAPLAQAEKFLPFIFPEERAIHVRHPSELPEARIPDLPPPPTVSAPTTDLPQYKLSLDEAIRTALVNAEVIRVLTGVSAAASGSTIYDTAVASTDIDQQRGRFDPTVAADNGFNRLERPTAVVDPLNPDRSLIGGLRTDDYALNLDVAKTTITGGTVAMGVNTNPSRFRPGIFRLNPQNASSAELSFTQPLLQGGGIRANLAPIVVARTDTERSYFQYKDSVQELVRGVVQAYWAVVFARTDTWARRQQVDQARFAYDLTRARKRHHMANIGDVAQSELALANFRSALIAARADLLDRQAALRNLLGLPPADLRAIVPVTPPVKEQFAMDWPRLLELAAERRPDVIELKLILEADQQLLLQARNDALPRVDAVGLYRWNGLEGRMPTGQFVSSRPGAFTDWTLAVNFSVPLGLRAERARLRRRRLIISRDRANLQQGLHGAAHDIAASLRNLAQFYQRYLAFGETRRAARTNLEVQLAEYRRGRVIFLNVLQAISDWGNAVSSEAQTLLQYNTELASLERQTGTILEGHGVRFLEERFGAIGPLGRLHRDRCYPYRLPPTANADRYPAGDQPAENSFNLRPPEDLQQKMRKNLEQLPRPDEPERDR